MAFTFKHGDRPLKGYAIQRGLGRGGFGEVYYAVSDGGREVALKYLHSHADVELRGIRQCMNLKSPHLVSIFDVTCNDAGDSFVIMEYISGPALRDILIAEPHGLGAARAVFFFKEIAKGLSYLHDRGIVHRDLKPGNVFYEEGYVKIGDYGLSKFISQSGADGNTASVGTVAYMAPEIGSGNYARNIDIYALGVMLYEMLVGKVPFEGQSAGEVLMKHLINQPEVDNLPAPFGQVIRKALAKDPQERYGSVAEMVEAALGLEAGSTHDRLEAQSLTQLAAGAYPRPDRAASDLGPAVPPRPFQGSSVIGETLPLGPRPLRPEHAKRPVADMRCPAYAGFWIRVCAWLLDLLVVSPLLPLLAFVPGAYFVSLFYSTLLLTFWDGQTVGKRICGLRVVGSDGEALTFWHALGRELAKWLSWMTCGVGYVMVGFTRYSQALHDLAASTVVVYSESVKAVRSNPPADGAPAGEQRLPLTRRWKQTHPQSGQRAGK